MLPIDSMPGRILDFKRSGSQQGSGDVPLLQLTFVHLPGPKKKARMKYVRNRSEADIAAAGPSGATASPGGRCSVGARGRAARRFESPTGCRRPKKKAAQCAAFFVSDIGGNYGRRASAASSFAFGIRSCFVTPSHISNGHATKIDDNVPMMMPSICDSAMPCNEPPP